MYNNSPFLFRKKCIEEKPHASKESGLMFVNFKKFVAEKFPDGITDEQWKEIEVNLQKNSYLHGAVS